VDQFTATTRPGLGRDSHEKVWHEAGRAYHQYAKMHRKMADRLLTLDQKVYRTAFPLKVIGI